MSVNVNPKTWGKKLWRSLHYMAFAYPEQPNEQQKQAASNLLYALKDLLPCERCRMHYAEYIAQHPPNVNSRTEFARYLNDLHNDVNSRLGKATVAYDPNQPYPKSNGGINWTQVLIAIVIGIMIGLLINRWRSA